MPSLLKVLVMVTLLGLLQLMIMELSSKNGGLLNQVKKELR